MKIYFILSLLLISLSNLAHANWKSKLYCVDAKFFSSGYVAEIDYSLDGKGLEREVHFRRNTNSQSIFVTDKCTMSDSKLICENEKISIKVDLKNYWGHRGLIRSYSYYDAEISKKTIVGTRTQKVRCR